MANDPVEVLTVQLEAEYTKLIQQTKEGVDKAEKELDKLSEAPKKATSAWGQFGSFLSSKFLGIITTIGAAIAAAFSVQAVTQFFSAIAKGMVDTNSQFETFRVQFETLLGSQGEARKRIEELARFGQKTPFELDEIVEANRLLQTFGGTALATGENLRRIGDSAAAVNADFKEVSFWTGRLYSAIQSGRPFGEASARLQELGILSGDVRTKLEDMQKAGKDGTEIWAAYSEMVDTRFSGAMDRLSKTLQGVMSNLADFQSMLLREGGEDLFEGVREDVIEFYDIISQPEAEEALVNLSKAFGSILDALREMVTTPFLQQLSDLEPGQMDSLAASIQDIGEAISGLSGLNVTSVSSLVDALDGMAQSVASIIQLVELLKELSLTASGIRTLNEAGVEFGEVFGPLLNPVYGLADAVDNLNSEIVRLTGSSISEWLGNVEQPAAAASSSLEAMGFAAEGVDESLRGAAQAAEVAAEDFTAAREKMEGLAQEFLDAQNDINEKRQEAEEEHGERVAEITEDYEERRAEIIEEFGERIAELDEEIAERREEIAENTAQALIELEQEIADARADAQADAAQALADLEADSQDQISDIQADAQQEEQRALEDHQREMRRIHQNYMMSLEEGVKNRDARAIVDARRKYQQDRQNAEEDFQTNQRRRREDTEQQINDVREQEERKRREIEEKLQEQLQDIEENEREKREEIEASNQEQLEKLAETEAEKRAELEESQAEQLANLDEHYAESLAKEEESYAERQAALDQALAQRLEAVAKELADENAITDEGAAAILETLNGYFGAGGDIDQLMESFRERRRATMRINIEFEENIGGGSSGGPLGEGGPLGSGDGSTPIPLPTFQDGGIVPGRKGMPRLVIAHGGEMVVPYNQIEKQFEQQKGQMEMNFEGNNRVEVDVKVSGSAPPGIEGPQIEMVAGVLVDAFKKAGIGARQKR